MTTRALLGEFAQLARQRTSFVAVESSGRMRVQRASVVSSAVAPLAMSESASRSMTTRPAPSDGCMWESDAQSAACLGAWQVGRWGRVTLCIYSMTCNRPLVTNLCGRVDGKARGSGHRARRKRHAPSLESLLRDAWRVSLPLFPCPVWSSWHKTI